MAGKVKQNRDAKKDRFWDLYSQGFSDRAIAEEVGIHRNTVRAWRNGLKDESGNARRDARANSVLRGPLPRKALAPEPLRALDDFEYFRRRYFGRISSPWQVDAAYKILHAIESPDREYIVLNCPPGSGKALSLDTPILTTRGWKTMGTLRVGEYVFDETGEPTQVVAKSEVFTDHDCYQVTADDGASVIADAEHLWQVRLDGYGQYHRGPKADYVGKTGPKPKRADGRTIITTESLAKVRSKRPQLQVAASVSFPPADLLIDPYVLGAWLGDGNSAGGRFTGSPEDAKWVRSFIEDAGYQTTDHAELKNWGVPGLQRQLRLLNLKHNKHIPDQYLFASAEQRLALLQGLIDTDGYVSPTGHVEFCNTKKNLAEGVQFLVNSLGAKASLRTGRAKLYGRDCGEKYRVAFYLKDAARLPRKALLTRDGVKRPPRYLTATKVATVPTQCIQVDSPSHLYLAGKGLMVTHNSTLLHDVECWLTCRDRRLRGMVGSSTQNLAIQYANRIRRSMERVVPLENEPDDVAAGRSLNAEATLPKDYGRFRSEDDLWQAAAFVVAQIGQHSIDEKEPSWQAYGLDQRYLGTRVQFAIWDDVVTKKSMRTSEYMEQQREDWDTEAESRINPGGALFLVGQRLGANDLYRYNLDKLAGDYDDFDDDELDADPTIIDPEGSQIPRMYHRIIYPAHNNELCKDEHKPEEAKAWPEGCLLDPWHLPWKDLRGIKARTPERFATVYQQQDTDPGHSLVPMHFLTGGEINGEIFPGCYDTDRLYQQLPKGIDLNRTLSILTIDPSPTAYWSCQWWLYNDQTELRYLMDMARKKMQIDEFLTVDPLTQVYSGVLEDLYQLSKNRGAPFKYLIMERNGFQRAFLQLDYFKDWARKRGVSYYAHDTGLNKSDPEYGVQVLAQHYRHGRYRLPNSQQRGDMGFLITKQLVKEVTVWPEKGTTDDCVMAQWFLEWWLPRLVMPSVDEWEDRWTPSFLGEDKNTVPFPFRKLYPNNLYVIEDEPEELIGG